MTTVRKTPHNLLFIFILLLLFVLQASTASAISEADNQEAIISELAQVSVKMMAADLASKSVCAQIFTGIAEKYPNHAYADDALYHAGLCFVAAGDYQGAIACFRQIVAKYPDGYLVVNGAWFTTMREIGYGSGDEGTTRAMLPHQEMRRDAKKAMQLYEDYMGKYPERTADWARYQMARVYSSYLNDTKSARQIVLEIPSTDLTRTDLMELQDKAFVARVDSMILRILRTRYSPVIYMEPRHMLADDIRRLRRRLGYEVQENTSADIEVLKNEAALEVDQFLRKRKVTFETVGSETSGKSDGLFAESREQESSDDAQQEYRMNVELLKDQSVSPVERNRAAVALGRLGNREAVPLLVNFVNSEEVPVAQNAIRALGRLKDPRAVAALLRVIQQPPKLAKEDVEMLQARAVSALESIGDVSALEALKEVAGGTDLPENLRQSVRTAVDRMEKRRSQTSTESSASTTAK